MKKMPRRTIAEQRLATLAASVRQFIIQHQMDEKPEEEDYDDTESAYGNGMDVANWDAVEYFRLALASVGMK